MTKNNCCCPTDKGVSKSAYTPVGDMMYTVGPLDSKTGVVIVGDIFGLLPNSLRLADVLADAGHLVAMPDFFGASAWDENVWPPDHESKEWKDFYALITNLDAHRPKAERAVKHLRGMGCTKVGIIGMCWGALITFQLAASGVVDCAVGAHPSFFTEDKVRSAKVPVCVLPSKDEADMEPVEKAVKEHPHQPSVYRLYPTLSHGFLGNRFDYDTCGAEEKAALDDAISVTKDFFSRTLK